jgi:hypothetical protein
MDLNLTKLVAATLHRIQDQRSYSLRGMAVKLRISPGHLSMIYTGQRSVGIGVLIAALREFPEMRQAIGFALLAPSLRKPEGH